jgi:hypothetical protein
MVRFFPRGRERPAGVCPLCGGSVVVRWTDKFSGEFHCTKCGECTTKPGRRPTNADRDKIKSTVDALWDGIARKGIRSMDVQVFLKMADEVALRSGHGRITNVRNSDLTRWGYEIVGSRIQKR